MAVKLINKHCAVGFFTATLVFYLFALAVLATLPFFNIFLLFFNLFCHQEVSSFNRRTFFYYLQFCFTPYSFDSVSLFTRLTIRLKVIELVLYMMMYWQWLGFFWSSL